MGWLSHILLGDLGQSVDIVETRDTTQRQQRTITRQGMELRGQSAEVARLKRRTEELHLALTALTCYLIESGRIPKDELAEFIRRIDSEDGEEDGRLAFDDPPAGPRLKFPRSGTSDEGP